MKVLEKRTVNKAPIYFFFHGSKALEGLGLHIVEVSRLHSDKPHSAGILCTSDRPVTETSPLLTTHTKHSQERDIHAPDEMRTHNPSKRAAADPPIRPRCH